MDWGDVPTASAAVIALVAAIVAWRQAVEARRSRRAAEVQVREARRAADAAEVQVREARRAADAAEVQVREARRAADAAEEQAGQAKAQIDIAKQQIEIERKHRETLNFARQDQSSSEMIFCLRRLAVKASAYIRSTVNKRDYASSESKYDTYHEAFLQWCAALDSFMHSIEIAPWVDDLTEYAEEVGRLDLELLNLFNDVARHGTVSSTNAHYMQAMRIAESLAEEFPQLVDLLTEFHKWRSIAHSDHPLSRLTQIPRKFQT